jgi:hypothetical protein
VRVAGGEMERNWRNIAVISEIVKPRDAKAKDLTTGIAEDTECIRDRRTRLFLSVLCVLPTCYFSRTSFFDAVKLPAWRRQK